MKILVFSDSHSERELMKSIISAQQPQMVLHLGDNTGDFKALKKQFPDIDIRGVRGNCDLRSNVEEGLIFIIEGKKVYMTHGHLYDVKIGYDRIYFAALERQVDILLFGHTHKAYKDIIRGIQVLNPGTIGKGRVRSYGIIEINDGVIVTKLIQV